MIEQIKNKIATAAQKAGKSYEDITIVCATKTRDISTIKKRQPNNLRLSFTLLNYCCLPQQFLYFLPEPHGQLSLRPTNLPVVLA